MAMPKVSVCVVSYNQKLFIEECLESLIRQDVDFEFEIIVSDDCSTDGTRLIVENYVRRYPGLIRDVSPDANLGPFKNYLRVHEQARGEYVAHMDGDDYALAGKLRKQAELLDSNVDCSMVFHLCSSLYPDGSLTLPKSVGGFEPCDFAQFIYRHPSRSWHSSKMYRRSANDFTKEKASEFIDKHIHFEHGLAGLVGFVDEVLGVYRVGEGISSNIYKTQKLALDSYSYAIKLGYDPDLIEKIIARENFEQGLRALSIGDHGAFSENVSIGYSNGYRTPNAVLAYALKSRPGVYRGVRDGLRWLRGKVRK